MNQNYAVTLSFAPVVLFVYNRPVHTEKVIRSLQLTREAPFTDLIIFSDAAKSREDAALVESVRTLISRIDGFNRVIIYQQPCNLGLAKSIIQGVSKIIDEYHAVIVLEDDIVVSRHFLCFMNDALHRYRYDKNVWHISGWNYPVNPDISEEDAFFWRVMNCWGWASWADRWQHLSKDPALLIKQWTKADIRRFNLDNHINFWSQVTRNATGNLNTWAVFWYATIFSQRGLCINPVRTMTKNIGHDGTGENCGAYDIFNDEMSDRPINNWPEQRVENTKVVNAIKKYHANPIFIWHKLKSKVRRVIMKLKS